MNESVWEFHLFAGIGGIYGGELFWHECRAGAEIGSRRQKSRTKI